MKSHHFLFSLFFVLFMLDTSILALDKDSNDDNSKYIGSKTSNKDEEDMSNKYWIMDNKETPEYNFSAPKISRKEKCLACHTINEQIFHYVLSIQNIARENTKDFSKQELEENKMGIHMDAILKSVCDSTYEMFLPFIGDSCKFLLTHYYHLFLDPYFKYMDEERDPNSMPIEYRHEIRKQSKKICLKSGSCLVSDFPPESKKFSECDACQAAMKDISTMLYREIEFSPRRIYIVLDSLSMRHEHPLDLELWCAQIFEDYRSEIFKYFLDNRDRIRDIEIKELTNDICKETTNSCKKYQLEL